MIDHLSSYTTDFPAAKTFYEAGLGSLGYEIQTERVATWDPEFPERRMCAWGPRHVAFSAPNRAAVDTFYNALVAAGGRDHGAPGIRETYHPDYYGAFVLDPDDNNVEACCHAPE